MKVGCLGEKKPNISKVEVSPEWRRVLSFRELVVVYQSQAISQNERRPGKVGIGPGPGGAAQAGRGLAVQLRRFPCPRPAPVLWARGASSPKR